jgi:hypothetical protein
MALRLWDNSWVDIAQAELLAEERVDLGNFLSLIAVDEEKCEAALVQAFHALKRYAFLVPGFAATRPEPFRLAELTADERALLPADFLYAVQMAQTLEADTLSGGGSAVEAHANERRRAGIIEETIGESSTKFASLGQVETIGALSHRSLGMLSGYLYRGIRIARA